MEQVSGQGRKSRNTAAEELSDNIETIEKTASVVVKGERGGSVLPVCHRSD